MNRTTDRVEIYERVDGTFGWRRIAPNGRIISDDAGQGYVAWHEAFRMAGRANHDVSVAEYDGNEYPLR